MEENIDLLVNSYKLGDTNSGEKLLELFKPLILKYMRFLTNGVYSPEDKDIISFIHLFSKDTNKALSFITYNCSIQENEELLQICQISLLQAARDTNSIRNNFKYILAKYLKDLVIKIPILSLEELYNRKIYIGNLFSKDIEESIEIDDAWVSGKTSNEMFSKLSVQQRQIVKMLWEDKIPKIHICSLLDISPSYLEVQIKNIKQILE